MECKICSVDKPLDEFAYKRGKPFKCKECHNAYQREYYSREGNREKQRNKVAEYKKSNPNKRYASLYGISEEEVQRIRDGICGICGSDGPIHIDHDHTTGAVRGGLCVTCNTGLGKFRDSTDYLEKAIAYLKQAPVV